MLHNGSTETARTTDEVQRVSEMAQRSRVKAQGVEFEPAKGSHFKIRLGNNQTIFPDHSSKEMGEGLRKQIIKRPGLKD